MNKLRTGIFLLLATIFFITISLGYYCCPIPLRMYGPQSDDLLETQYITENTVTHSIIAKDDGSLELNGDDCYFEITDIKNSGSTVVLFFDQPYESAGPVFYVSLDYGDGEGYHEAEGEILYVASNKLADCVCLPLPTDNYVGVRIRPNMSLKLSKIEIHDKEPVAVFKKNTFSKRQFLKGILVGLFCALIIAILEAIFKISGSFCAFVKKNKKSLIQDGVVLVAATLISMVCNQMFGQGQYSVSYHALIVTAVLSAFVLLRNGLVLKTAPEQTFLALLIFTGVCMTLCCWPNVSWDAMIHYQSTLLSTQAGDVIGVTDGNAAFFSVFETNQTYSQLIDAVNAREIGVSFWLDQEFSLIRMPAAIWMILGNVLGVSAYTNYCMGRLGQLLVFVLCGYFGMKRLHSGKMIFAVIYMMPVNIFLATNYSYDYEVTAFLMLGMAYFVGMCQEKQKGWEAKDVIIMLLAFYFGCMAKQIYMPIFFFTFLMSTKKLKNKKKLYYFLCTIATIAALAAFAIASLNNVNGEQDMRAGLGEVDGKQQFLFITGHFGLYLKQMFAYMFQWWNPHFNETGTCLAYLGVSRGYLIIVALLAFVTLTDKEDCDKGAYPVLARIYGALYFVGESALVVTALYMAFSPIGSDYMAGAQPRYYIPMIYPLCAVITGGGIPLRKIIPDHIYQTVTMGIMTTLIFVSVYDVVLPMTLY